MGYVSYDDFAECGEYADSLDFSGYPYIDDAGKSMNESQEAPRCSYRAFPVDSNCAKAQLIFGGAAPPACDCLAVRVP